MSEVKRWMSSHPGITRDMKEVVLARDFDALVKELRAFTSSSDTPEMIRLWHIDGKRHRVTVLDDYDFETAINPDVKENSKEYILFSAFDSVVKERDELKDKLERLEGTCQNTFNHWQYALAELQTLKAERNELKTQFENAYKLLKSRDEELAEAKKVIELAERIMLRNGTFPGDRTLYNKAKSKFLAGVE